MKKTFLFFHSIIIVNSLFAQWNSDPVTGATIVNNAITSENNQVSISDGANGTIIIFESSIGNGVNNLYAQRINSNGQIQWGLTNNPKPVCVHASEKYIDHVIPDGSGGVFIAWFDYRRDPVLNDIYVQHLNSSGDPLWAVNGVLINNVNDRSKDEVRLCADESGGVIVVWAESLYDSTTSMTVYSQLFAQRYNNAGATQWSDGGVEVCTNSSLRGGCSVVPDGAGGVIVSFTDTRNSAQDEDDVFDNLDIYAQRINSSGDLLWTADGMPVNIEPFNQIVGDEYLQTNTSVSDGSGGVIILFDDYTNDNNGNGTFYAQHLNSSGAIQWASTGIPVCVSGAYKFLIKAITDGSGGMVAFWSEDRSGVGNYSSYAQRILSGGSTGWTTDGLKLIDNSGGFGGFENDMTEDGNGNYIFTWTDIASNLLAQKINGSGAIQWGVTNKQVCTNTNANPVLTRIVKSDAGNTIVTWLDNRNYANSSTDIYAAKLDTHGYLIGQPSASEYITVANGNWNNGSTWQGGTVPPATADVKIRHNVVVNSNTSCHSVRIEQPNGNLTVNAGSNLSILQ